MAPPDREVNQSSTSAKMAILHSCCCWNNVRSGSLASGIYTLTMSIVNGGLIAYNLVNLPAIVESEQSNGSVERNVKVAYGWFILTLVIAVLLFFTSILLIIGVHKDNRHLLLPWIAVAITIIADDTAVLIYQCVVFGLLTYNLIQMVIWLGLTLLNIYCILCVISQYQELKDGRGTMEAIQRQRATIIYRTGVQQVHITQGPIVMASPFAVPTSVQSVTTLQPAVTTTVIMAPPAYNVAATELPQYHPPTSTQTQTDDVVANGQTGTGDPLLTVTEKKGSPPPPYRP